MRAQLQTLHANIETVTNARQSWSTRVSVRLILDDGAGHVGLGEAAPLAGFSPDDPTRARRALANVRWPERVPESLEDVQAVVSQIDPAFPSARFAAETALASLAASVMGIPLWGLLAEDVESVPISTTLWSRAPNEVRAHAAELASFGVSSVKLKVGGKDRESELAALAEVREALPNAELRLDANGCLDPAELDERIDELERFGPAFLEEPSPLDAILARDARWPIPFALDESLASDPETCLTRALNHDAIGVIVIKPTLLGGLARSLALAGTARAAGRKVVVSHLLEGVIARAAAAHLALALGGEAAGLGEHPALDPLSDGLLAGWIDVAWIEPPDTPGLGLDVVW